MPQLFILLPKSCTYYVPTVSTVPVGPRFIAPWELLQNKYIQCPDRPRHVSTRSQQARRSKLRCHKCLNAPSKQTSTLGQGDTRKMYCLKCPDCLNRPNQALFATSETFENVLSQMSHVPTGIANVSLSSSPDNIRITASSRRSLSMANDEKATPKKLLLTLKAM